MRIDDETLSEWEAVEKAASDGPWTISSEEITVIEDGERRYDHVVWGPFNWVATAGTNEKRKAPNDDARFIASARNAFPALLSAYRELKAENERFRKELAPAPLCEFCERPILGGRPHINCGEVKA